MSRSGVVAAESGGSEISEIRTSSGVFLDRGQDEVVKAVEERIAAWTLMPVGNGEGLQVLKYDPSQKYDAHWDYL
jgi:prolyl 4-hydroxylase